LSVTDPTGAVTDYTCDYTGRLATSTQVEAPSAGGIAVVVAVTRPHLAFARYLTGLPGRPAVNPGEVRGWHELAPSSAR
jgi:hypothetical protein